MAQTRYKMIDNPLGKIAIDNNYAISLIEIFVTRKDAYNELCKRKNVFCNPKV